MSDEQNKKKHEPAKPEFEYRVLSASTIGQLEKQLNEQAAEEFFVYKVLCTSKDQYIAIFLKTTEAEAPSAERLEELLGGSSMPVPQGATREASNS